MRHVIRITELGLARKINLRKEIMPLLELVPLVAAV
jgi:hypothetical protein